MIDPQPKPPGAIRNSALAPSTRGIPLSQGRSDRKYPLARCDVERAERDGASRLEGYVMVPGELVVFSESGPVYVRSSSAEPNYREMIEDTWAGSENRLLRFDDLVGVTEIGRRLGVDRQRVHQLKRRQDFPKMLGVIGGALLWTWPEIDAWSRTRHRKGGRPRKTPGQVAPGKHRGR